jgi:hypothetical protein
VIHEDDLQHELTALGWREYKLRTLVPRDPADFNADELTRGAQVMAERLIGKRQRGEAMTTAEHLIFDLLNSYDDNVLVMGPVLDAAVCERGHVIDVKEDRAFCSNCEAEAERWHEARLNG